MSLVAAFVDARGAVRSWVNNHPDLKGVGKPITLGAFFDPRTVRSPSGATYVILTRIGRRPDDSEARLDPARISAVFHGDTIEAVDLAAVAFANALLTVLPGTVMGDAICHTVGIDTGPLSLPADPQSNKPSALVDATFDLAPPA